MPDEILHTCPLTVEEWRFMRQHPVIGARIIAACDAYDAMVSERVVYRPARGSAAALAELRRHAGSQFDPEVVAALCRRLEVGGRHRRGCPTRQPLRQMLRSTRPRPAR